LQEDAGLIGDKDAMAPAVLRLHFSSKLCVVSPRCSSVYLPRKFNSVPTHCYRNWINYLESGMQTLRHWRNCYVPEGQKQVRFCPSRNLLYIRSNIYAHTWESNWNPNYSTMEHFRTKHESVIPSVMTQRYFSATSPIAHSHPQVKFRRLSKILSFNVLNF